MKFLKVFFSLVVISSALASLSCVSEIQASSGVLCERVFDSKGQVEGFYTINGIVYRVFTVEETEKLASNIKIKELLEEQLKLKDDKIGILNSTIKEQNLHISFLEKRLESHDQIVKQMLENGDVGRFVDKPIVPFVAGVGTCSAMYSFWSYTNRR